MAIRFFRLFACRRSGLSQQKRKGTTATEMALLAPAFFLLLIGITELSLILTAQQLLENAAYNASRLAKTGYVNGTLTQSQTVLQVVTDELSSFGSLIDTGQITTTSTSYTSFSSIGTGGTAGYGTEQQIVVYTVTYPWKIFTPMIGHLIGTWDSGMATWVINLTSRIVVRNEPYG